MAHLDEGALQAYLDEETTGRERAAAAEHLLACGECRGQLDALRRANVRLSAALAELDFAAPAPAPRQPLSARSRRTLGGGSFIRAAAMVLVLAAAASASVPGSPVREWIVQAVRPTEPPPVPAAVEQPAEPPLAAPTAEAPAGIAVPGLRSVDVMVTGLDDVAIRLVRVPAGDVSVSARGGTRDPHFRFASGRIEVAGGAGGELLIEVPESGSSVRLVVDGRRYAEVERGEVRVLVQGERDGSAVVWP